MLVTGGGGMLPLFDSGRAEGMDSAPEEPSFWDEFKRGLGTRNVLEGLGRGVWTGNLLRLLGGTWPPRRDWTFSMTPRPCAGS